MIQVVNTTSATLAAGATIPPGTTRIRTSNRANLNGSTLEIVEPGTYKVDASFVISATAAGLNEVQLYANGTAVPGALAQVSTTAADNVITLPVSAVVQAIPAAPGNKVALTWVTSEAGTLINASETVSRIV